MQDQLIKLISISQINFPKQLSRGRQLFNNTHLTSWNQVEMMQKSLILWNNIKAA